MSERGKYVVIEGNDGTGKSSQVGELQRRLGGLGIKSIEIHEPDGVPAARELRKIIKDGTLKRDAWSNVLLFTAARRLNWLQAMQPALESGVWVLAARSWLSTVAYQGYGEGIDVDRIRRRTLEDVGEEYVSPDMELILTLHDDTVRQSRISQRGALEKPDTFESRDDRFQRALEEGYKLYAADNDIPLVDASPDFTTVAEAIWRHVQPLTKEGSYETVS